MLTGGALSWSLCIVWKLNASVCTGTGKDSRGRLCSELEEQSRPHPDLTHSDRDPAAATALVFPAEEWVTILPSRSGTW